VPRRDDKNGSIGVHTFLLCLDRYPGGKEGRGELSPGSRRAILCSRELSPSCLGTYLTGRPARRPIHLPALRCLTLPWLYLFRCNQEQSLMPTCTGSCHPCKAYLQFFSVDSPGSLNWFANGVGSFQPVPSNSLSILRTSRMAFSAYAFQIKHDILDRSSRSR
jgi:hypothetical protein